MAAFLPPLSLFLQGCQGWMENEEEALLLLLQEGEEAASPLREREGMAMEGQM